MIELTFDSPSGEAARATMAFSLSVRNGLLLTESLAAMCIVAPFSLWKYCDSDLIKGLVLGLCICDGCRARLARKIIKTAMAIKMATAP